MVYFIKRMIIVICFVLGIVTNKANININDLSKGLDKLLNNFYGKWVLVDIVDDCSYICAGSEDISSYSPATIIIGKDYFISSYGKRYENIKYDININYQINKSYPKNPRPSIKYLTINNDFVKLQLFFRVSNYLNDEEIAILYIENIDHIAVSEFNTELGARFIYNKPSQ